MSVLFLSKWCLMFLHFGFDCCQSTASIATERADMLKRDLLQRCLCMSALIVNNGCCCCFIINVHFVNLLINVCGRGSCVLCMFLYIIIISETKCALLKYLALKKIHIMIIKLKTCRIYLLVIFIWLQLVLTHTFSTISIPSPLWNRLVITVWIVTQNEVI